MPSWYRGYTVINKRYIKRVTSRRNNHPNLFGVLKIFKEGILVPGDALIDVGSCVRETLGLPSFAAKNAVKYATSGMDGCTHNGCRRTREGWGRLCEGHRLRQYGTVRTGS